MICPDCQQPATSAAIPARSVAPAEVLCTDEQHLAEGQQPHMRDCWNSAVRWFVTLPVQTTEGLPGSQIFVITACSADIAAAAALTRATLPDAQRRRRGATLQEGTAVVEAWHSIDDLLRAGW